MSVPSFAQLFRRSRYSRFGPLGNDEQELERRKKENERKEIFAVAAVGFVLKHDKQFKKNFLKKFAGIDDDAEEYEPNLQPADCIDLELKNREKWILVAVEFKVGSELADHQNPWLNGQKPDSENLPFWNVTDKGKGYGYQFRQKDYEQFSTIHYVTVQQNFDVEKNGGLHNDNFRKAGKTFSLKSRAWGTLLDPKSGLEEDLVESLGELGIEELEDWHMKRIRIKNEDLEALFKGTNAMELLWHVTTKLTSGKEAAKQAAYDLVANCTKGSRGDSRQLCVTLPRERIKKLVGIRAQYEGVEYGYYSVKNSAFGAEVWFYNYEQADPKLQALIEKELKESARVQEIPHDSFSERGLRVIRSDESSLGDSEWFCKVLGIK